jgi:pimeloyl-ACP methyl ester carboxylesterase
MKTSNTRTALFTSLIISALFLVSFLNLDCGQKRDSTVENDSNLRKNVPVNDCYDLSNHKVSFITTAPGVSLEVLDWGGTGDYLVLLTGLGDNAHVFDNFAYQFTDLFHVIGITRRGFGKSSKPEDGYDEATRVRDYMSILDQLNIPKASFAGHSIACGELCVIGSKYGDRVNKLVFLDGLDYGEQKNLKQPPGPDYTDEEISSLDKFMATLVRFNGYREPNAAICDLYTMDSEGKITGTVSPPEITAKLVAANVTSDFSLIKAPVLGIFEAWTINTHLPFYNYFNREKQAEYDSAFATIYEWRERRLGEFRTQIKNCKVIEMPNCNHYVFITKEWDVAREMRKFLTGK